MPSKLQESVRKGLPYLYFVAFGGALLIAAGLPPLAASLSRSKNVATASSVTPAVLQSIDRVNQSFCASPNPLTESESSAIEAATWAEQPLAVLETQLAHWSRDRFAALAPLPQPHIHERARLAKVPVFMYHDILPEKEVFFDVTPEELEADFELMQSQGVTPISLAQLVTHLRTGMPLPNKPVVLTFDDGYGGHYEHVYPLLKKYGYPATFSIYTANMGEDTGRTHVSWAQLREMAADPLVTVAAHSVTHPMDLRALSNEELEVEVMESKQLLEEQLGIPIHYFTYPTGYYNRRVRGWATAAGYRAALTMDDQDEGFAGESEDLLAIRRFGQSSLEETIAEAWGGAPLARDDGSFNFTGAVRKQELTVDEIPVTLISGGKPTTIHAESRYQVLEIIQDTEAVAAVDGAFFSMKYLDSNVTIGPALSQEGSQFVPGNEGENIKLAGRPLVLIGADAVQFIPFEPEEHNTRSGIASEMASVTDAFVAAAWLVRDGKPQSAQSFGTLFDFDAARHRAFWGINSAGQPTIGVSHQPVDSVALGKILHQAGLHDAVMLDSGGSTSLAYQGESLVGYIPRPVPHVVALLPTDSACTKEPDSESLARGAK